MTREDIIRMVERHQAFLKEAEALGYVFRLDVDTQAWDDGFKEALTKPKEKNT